MPHVPMLVSNRFLLRASAALLITSFSCWITFAADEIVIAPPVHAVSAATAPDGITRAERLRFEPALPAALLAAPHGEPIRLRSWPVAPGRREDVVVTRREVYEPNAKLYVVGKDGPVETARSRIAFFQGQGDSAEDAPSILLGVDPDRMQISAFARTDDGWSEMRPAGGEGTASEYLLAASTGFDEAGAMRRPFRCGEEELAKARPVLRATAPMATEALAATRQVTIAVDTDNELMGFKFSNNVTNATNYVAQLVALMSVIYERDLNVRLLQGTTFFRVSTTPDPYVENAPDGADGDKLDEFGSYWETNYAGVSRALAMMLSGKELDNDSTSGIAYIDALCSHSSGYSFSQVFKYSGSTAASDRDLVGHELGHNFGSDHTHCYEPPIDMCWSQEAGCYSGAASCPAAQTINGVANVRGTIMSYCDNLNGCGASGVFHPRTVSVLSPIIASQDGVCVFPTGTSSPKEASPGDNLRAQRGTGSAVTVTYTPACGATQHTVYSGNLITLRASGIAWSQRACTLGTAGSLSFTPTGSVYFVVVGNNGTNEGSYGQGTIGERPPASAGTPCSYTQDLSGSCP